MKIGKAHQNFRSANRRCETCYMILKNLKIYPILTLVVWACREAWERQYIGAGGPRCASILAHWCPPPPIGNFDQAQCAIKFFPCSVRHSYWRRVNRCANSIGGLQVRWLCSVRLTCFHTNPLLIELFQQEMEIRCKKDDGPIKM